MSGAVPSVPAGDLGVVYAKKTKVQPIVIPEQVSGKPEKSGVKLPIAGPGDIIPTTQPGENGNPNTKVPSIQLIRTPGPVVAAAADISRSSGGVQSDDDNAKSKPQLKPVVKDSFKRPTVGSEDEDKMPTLHPLVPSERVLETRPRMPRQLLQFKCPECAKTFPNKKTLDSHLTSHPHPQIEKKLFSCRFCEKVFRWKQTLKNHEDTHVEGFQPYKCNKCSKLFTLRGSWVSHCKAVSCSDNSDSVEGDQRRRKQSFGNKAEEAEPPIVIQSKSKRQSAPPEIPASTSTETVGQQSGLPIKKRGRPAKFVQRPVSLNLAKESKDKPKIVVKSEPNKSVSPTPQKTTPPAVSANSSTVVSPALSNGSSAVSVKVESESPEPGLRSQRKRNPPKWTENMVMDYDISFANTVPRASRTSGSRKSSMESNSTEASGRNADVNSKKEIVPDDSVKSGDKNSQSLSTVNKSKEIIKEVPNGSVEKVSPPRIAKDQKMATSATPVVEIFKVQPIGLSAMAEKPTSEVEVQALENTKGAPQSSKIAERKESSDQKSEGVPPTVEPTKGKSELSSKIQNVLLERFVAGIKNETAKTDTDVAVPIAHKKADKPETVAAIPIKRRKRRKGRASPAKKFPPAKSTAKEVEEVPMDGPNEEKEKAAVPSNQPVSCEPPAPVSPEKAKAQISESTTPVTVTSSNAEGEGNKESPALDAPVIPKSPPKRGRPRLVSASSTTPPKLPKLDVMEKEPEVEKQQSSPQEVATQAALEEVAEAFTNGFGVPSPPPPTSTDVCRFGANFSGMPRLLNQISPPLEFVGSDKSSDSEEEEARYGNMDFLPPGGRRLSTEPYIKDEAISFLARKISNRNMLRIRQELMQLKQGGNYFKLTKTAPLAAGLIHDMFCQELDLSRNPSENSS